MNNEIRIAVARRFLSEATSEPQPIDLLVNRVAGIEGVDRLSAASIFWGLVREEYIDRFGRKVEREARS